MRKLMIVTLLLMFAAPLAHAQGFTGSADVVTVSGARAAAKAGERVEFTIGVKIDKTWHLYAHGDTNFIGMDLVPDEGLPVTDLTVHYPEGHEVEVFGDMMVMIEGDGSLKAAATVPADLAAGTYDLGFKLTAQACDDKVCLRPAYIPVTVKLTVE